MTATTGAMRRYGIAPAASRRRESRRRRACHIGLGSAAAPIAVGALPLRELFPVEGLRDVYAGYGRRLLDGQLTGEDLRQHRLEDVAVLDVDPVLGLRHEPAPRGRA